MAGSVLLWRVRCCYGGYTGMIVRCCYGGLGVVMAGTRE